MRLRRSEPPEPPHYWCEECRGAGGDREDGKCLCCDGLGIVELDAQGEVVRPPPAPETVISAGNSPSGDFGDDDIPF